MIYSESALARRMFARFLPAYASRAGYFDGVSPEGLFPERIYPIPVHLAPAASLDGIWVDSAHAPQNSKDLAAVLQTLGAGGVGILFLPAKHWSRRAISDFCRGAGMQLLFLSPVPAKGRIKMTPAGLPVPRSILRRILLRLVTAFFPSLAGIFGRELFVIVQKSPARHRETDGMRLSVIIPALTADRLKQWEEFIARHRVHEVELISVEDDVSASSVSGASIHVQHYREAGRAEAIRSGLLHSRGKSVLIDADQRCSPEYLFDLMHARMQAKQKADIVVGLDGAGRLWWGRRLINRWLTGFSDPDPLFLLLSDRAIRDWIDLHPEQMSGYAYAAGLHMRSKLQIEEVELAIEPPLPPRRRQKPSLLLYILHRVRRGSIYLVLPLLLPLLLYGMTAVSLPELDGRPVLPAEAIRAAAFRPLTVRHWSEVFEAGLTLGAKAFVFTEDVLIPAAQEGVRWTYHLIPPPQQKELAARFFFVLLAGQLIHLWNVIAVFRRPSGSLLPWAIAQGEALLILLWMGRDPLLDWKFSTDSALSLFSAGLALHVVFFLAYRFLFRPGWGKPGRHL